MTPVPPSTLAEWTAWVRDTNPAMVRVLAGVTQTAMAFRVGVPQSTFSRWESGTMPLDTGRAAAWFAAVTELQEQAAAREAEAAARAEREGPVLAAHRAGTLVLG